MTYNDVLRVVDWGCVQRCGLWHRGEEAKKDKLSAQTTHVDVPPWNFACGVVSGR